jgi:hypothetical protein
MSKVAFPYLVGSLLSDGETKLVLPAVRQGGVGTMDRFHRSETNCNSQSNFTETMTFSGVFYLGLVNINPA